MIRSIARTIVLALIVGLWGSVLAGCTAGPQSGPRWVAAWGAPPDQAGQAIPPLTVRQIVHISLGGSAVRLRFSNLYGDGPLTLGPVRVARHAGGSAIRSETDRPVTFDGKSSVTIPKGAAVLSDPVALQVEALEDIAVSLYLPAGSSSPTWHGVGAQTAYLAPGEVTAAATLPAARTDTSRYFLTDVEVAASPVARLLVIAGDSITDGVGSTDDGNLRWPDQLAARLQADPALRHIAVVNSGIAGNRVLNDDGAPFIGQSLLNRFDRDVLDKPGIRWVLILHGGNDITASGILKTAKDDVSADQIIDGYRQLIARAHARGVGVWGATFTPQGGREGFFALSPENMAKREAVNAWIRTSGAFDAVIDFEAAMRDPAHSGQMLAAYDSGDQIHPNDAGYKSMAAAIDLRLFTRD